MEDTIIACKIDNCGQEDAIFGVFDGHGGPEVAILSKTIFPSLLTWNLKTLSS